MTTSPSISKVFEIYRISTSMKDITDALVRSKDQKISLMWQTFAEHKTLFQFQIIELNFETKRIVVSYEGKKDFIDPNHPVFIKLFFRETLFKGKVIKCEVNKLTLSIPREIHLREYREGLRVSFLQDEESVLVRQVQPIVNGANFPTLKIMLKDICPKGLGLIISRPNMHLFRSGQLLEILGFSNLILPVPIIGRVIYAVRYVAGGRKLHYKVGVELVSNLPDREYEELIKNKLSTFQTTSKDLIESPAFKDDFRVHFIYEASRINEKLKERAVIQKYIRFIEDNSQIDFHLTEHIQMLPVVCAYISEAMGLVLGLSLEKFIYAAYMHDSAFFEYPRLAKIKNDKDFLHVKDQLSEEEKKIFLNSGAMASKTISLDAMASEDVIEMILLHKEFSHSHRFLSELTHSKVSTLVAIFIVAHDLTEEIISNHDWSIERWLLKVKDIYSRGEFKKIIDAILASKNRPVSRATLNGMR